MSLHLCGPLRARVETAKDLGRRANTGGRKRPMTVDFHCHIFAPAVEPLVADRPLKRDEPAMMLKSMGEASVAHNNAVMLPRAFPKLTRLEERLADMNAMGVDVQVLSPSPTQYYYWAERELARELVRVQNEHVAETCARHPDRLVGLGTLALQHPTLAVEQLEHALGTLGLKGVEISTSINGEQLDSERFDPFWRKAEELGAVVFIHPFGTTLAERTRDYYLSNIIGQPLETTLALSHLIFGGTLDRYSGLKIVAAHGGGYLPSYCGRSNHGHAVRPEAQRHAKSSPGEYLRNIWFDTLVYEPEALRHLVNTVGASQLVVGTDYPFDMGHYDPHGLLAATAGLDEAQTIAILGGNALALLGISAIDSP